MRQKDFLRMFYEDKTKQTFLQFALTKAINIKDEEKFKFYTLWINDLEARMTDYINKNAKLVKRIDFVKESQKYRIDTEEQKVYAKHILNKEMTIDEIQEWMETKEW